MSFHDNCPNFCPSRRSLFFKMAKSGRVPYLFVSVAVCDFVHAQSPTGSEIAVAKSLSINSYKHVCG